MSAETIFAYIAASLAATIAIAAMFRSGRSGTLWLFVAGMLYLVAESIFAALGAAEASSAARQVTLQSQALLLRSVGFVIWILFSNVYSRGEVRRSLKPWMFPLIAAVAVPVVLAYYSGGQLLHLVEHESGEFGLAFTTTGKFLNGLILLEIVIVLMSLELTFRAAVGTMQWRIKFTILGLAVISATRFYTCSQALVYSGQTSTLSQVDVAGLIIGCLLLGIGYLRAGLNETDVYPSGAVLHTSITVLLVGGYLLVVGVLAQIVAHTGAAGSFQLEALLVLLALAVLAVMLLSKRWRQRLRNFISRHFRRPQYDAYKIWTDFTDATTSAADEQTLCSGAAKLISGTFNVLSVSLWVWNEERQRLARAGSTVESSISDASDGPNEISGDDLSLLAKQSLVDLDRTTEPPWEKVRLLNQAQFSRGGDRYALPLVANERCLGLVLLADRVSAVEYSSEEFELLKCICDQTASSLLNLQLGRELLLSKELEAFQTISAFFVHDMKNAASTLRLMLRNLPEHFDDPEFRRDALRGIGDTAGRIDQIIERLGAVQQKVETQAAEVDLVALVAKAVDQVETGHEVAFLRELQAVGKVMGDREQLRSVVTNLLLNAREAVSAEGRVEVKTEARPGWGVLTVSDNGCGMSAAFMRDSLFRPFKTTKKKGLGIGMFHTKTIIQAHRGTIRVKSEPGQGTTFQVWLPLARV